MIYTSINNHLYPAEINGKLEDREWNNRESKAITLEMTYAEATELFVDGAAWSIVIDVETEDENGIVVATQEEYDNSDYCVAGDIIDHRDGTITVKMGKFTTEEMLLMEVLA